jgi:cell division transport system permease protein
MKDFVRAFKTTLKQIKRAGWISWASVGVMSLAFIVTTIFFGLAFVMNTVLKSIENDPHIYVFFQPGTTEEKIIDTKKEWENLENIQSIIYTSEQEALQEFKSFNEKANPITAEAIRENVLPASLGIRLEKIDAADEIIKIMQDIERSDKDILKIGYSETTIQNIKDIVNIIRIGGGIIIGLLVIVVLLFTLLTVEFRIYNRSEEIGIMQLVGGSLWYIRLPFILESIIYGILGALFSNILMALSGFLIYQYYLSEELLKFVNRFFGNLPWPEIGVVEILIVFLGSLLIGGLIGGINSYIAIKRYIK